MYASFQTKTRFIYAIVEVFDVGRPSPIAFNYIDDAKLSLDQHRDVGILHKSLAVSVLILGLWFPRVFLAITVAGRNRLRGLDARMYRS